MLIIQPSTTKSWRLHHYWKLSMVTIWSANDIHHLDQIWQQRKLYCLIINGQLSMIQSVWPLMERAGYFSEMPLCTIVVPWGLTISDPGTLSLGPLLYFLTKPLMACEHIHLQLIYVYKTCMPSWTWDEHTEYVYLATEFMLKFICMFCKMILLKVLFLYI